MKLKVSIIFIAVFLLTSCTGPISERDYKEPWDRYLLYSLDDMNKLIKMAEKRFGRLTRADKILFLAVATGTLADYTKGSDTNEPNNTDSRSNMQIIKATRIEWLCKNRDAKKLVSDDGINIKGAKIEGEIRLSDVDIPFPLFFLKCVFSDEILLKHSNIRALGLSDSHVVSIDADGLKVGSFVFLRDGFKAKGEIRFPRATIGGDFDCKKGEFNNEKGTAISAAGMRVEGNVYLSNGFKAKNMVSFSGAVIGGDFSCINGEFTNEGGIAILADRINVKGNVYLRDGNTKGGVRFTGAVIGGSFDCTKGQFINEDGIAILADGIDVKGGVYLRDGNTKGGVRFTGAVIGGSFDCMKGEFINKDGEAILAEGIDVKGSVFLSYLKAEGLVDFNKAIVGGHFIWWTNVNLTEETILDLSNAEVGVLWDEEKSWPKKGNLFLDGFIYENIDDNAPKDAKSRIEWLNRQGGERFQPGPYEQLAKVLNKMGRSEDAKKILIEKEEKLTRLSGFSWWRRLWRDILGVTIGYGYRPWRVLWFIGAITFIGTVVFWSGYKAGIIVPAEEGAYVSGQRGQLREGYPKFNAFVYSIDMFVPLVNLYIAKYWRPDTNKSEIFRFKKYSFHIRGDFIRVYMWVHICAGWIFTTLLVVGLTGLVRK